MKFVAGMLVVWSSGALTVMALAWGGVSVRRGWRRRAPRLVAWGGAAGDVQVGSFEDMTRLCEQLIEAANLTLLSIVSGLPVLETASGQWPAGRTHVDMVSARGAEAMDVYVVPRRNGITRITGGMA